ncbi:Versicolorin B desaturase [Venturia inaequalis]|nr:Versicolorin B desaturase [Venturia inaequalis]
MSNSTLFFQPSCPSGGSFYVCNTLKSSFVGCCATDVDPCTSPNGCSKGNLRSTSFDKTYFGQFHDQSCNDGSFYTCTGTKPGPFMGCCKSNPCANGGCAAVDLEAMRLSSDPKAAADFLGTSVSTSSSSSTTATGSSTSSSTSTALPAEVPHQTGLPIAAIVGIRPRLPWHTPTIPPNHFLILPIHQTRQGHFSGRPSVESDPRTSPYGGRSPQCGSDNGMLYPQPLLPVQELEALEQQMSEMDAGTESQALRKGGVKRRPIDGDEERGGEYVAYSSDGQTPSGLLPPRREGS